MLDVLKIRDDFPMLKKEADNAWEDSLERNVA